MLKEEILKKKTPKLNVVGIFPPNLKKNESTGKGKENESYIFIVYIIFNIHLVDC